MSLLREGRGGRFRTTSWSLVLAAADQPATSAEAALAELCEIYWYPIYAFVRRLGYSQDDCGDLTQEFFARLLEKNFLKDADPARGRFRSFLLSAVRHFLANEWNKGQARKRGGGVLTIALDYRAAEDRYCKEPADDMTPEKLYERQWALALLDRVLSNLRLEYADAGRTEDFDILSPFLTGTGEFPYATIAHQLKSTEGAVKVAVHRLRKRYRVHLRQKIAETLGSLEDTDDEIRFLLKALGDSK